MEEIDRALTEESGSYMHSLNMLPGAQGTLILKRQWCKEELDGDLFCTSLCRSVSSVEPQPDTLEHTQTPIEGRQGFGLGSPARLYVVPVTSPLCPHILYVDCLGRARRV